MLMILTFETTSETIKCNHSNEICGVVLLFVYSRSEEVTLRLRNKLSFPDIRELSEHKLSQSDLLINETMENVA